MESAKYTPCNLFPYFIPRIILAATYDVSGISGVKCNVASEQRSLISRLHTDDKKASFFNLNYMRLIFEWDKTLY